VCVCLLIEGCCCCFCKEFLCVLLCVWVCVTVTVASYVSVCDGVWGFSLLWELIHGIGFWFAFLLDGIIRFVCVVVFFFSFVGCLFSDVHSLVVFFLFEFWGGCVCVCV
jgi:hypothetical protein